MGKSRRKAVNCVMLEESKTSPGYFKYQITIREKDGTEHVVPAYGKDMQDAIERVIAYIGIIPFLFVTLSALSFHINLSIASCISLP